jgi:hypothetical protein
MLERVREDPNAPFEGRRLGVVLVDLRSCFLFVELAQGAGVS